MEQNDAPEQHDLVSWHCQLFAGNRGSNCHQSPAAKRVTHCSTRFFPAFLAL